MGNTNFPRKGVRKLYQLADEKKNEENRNSVHIFCEVQQTLISLYVFYGTGAKLMKTLASGQKYSRATYSINVFKLPVTICTVAKILSEVRIL